MEGSFGCVDMLKSFHTSKATPNASDHLPASAMAMSIRIERIPLWCGASGSRR